MQFLHIVISIFQELPPNQKEPLPILEFTNNAIQTMEQLNRQWKKVQTEPNPACTFSYWSPIKVGVTISLRHFGYYKLQYEHIRQATSADFCIVTFKQLQNSKDNFHYRRTGSAIWWATGETNWSNLLGVISVSQAFVLYFREKKSGLFITTTSIGGLLTFPLDSMYHATKWTLKGWSESMSFELGLHNIGWRIRTVWPSDSMAGWPAVNNLGMWLVHYKSNSWPGQFFPKWYNSELSRFTQPILRQIARQQISALYITTNSEWFSQSVIIHSIWQPYNPVPLSQVFGRYGKLRYKRKSIYALIANPGERGNTIRQRSKNGSLTDPAQCFLGNSQIGCNDM